MTNVNGRLFYTATDGINGRELWTSDGSEAGTAMVKAIFPGNNQIVGPNNLTNVDGTLYFSADDGVSGNELWRSDGSSTGTVLVQDSTPGPNDSNPSFFINVNGTLFFWHGGLRKSNGTKLTTVLVKDGITPSGEMSNVNGVHFFGALDGANDSELWKSDGTAVGTTLVKNIHPTGPSSPRNLTNVNGTLYFEADDGTTGDKSRTQLFRSDGTSNGTIPVKGLDPNGNQSNIGPKHLTNANGTLFFSIFDSTNGYELWTVQ